MSVARGILRLVIRVVTSHRTEVLLDAFVRDISAERERKGAFAPLAVVVPNSNVEAYLRHVINVIPDHPIKRIEELLPWNVKL